MQKITEAICNIVKQECLKESNPFGNQSWDYHALAVVKFALQLADKLGADKEIVEIAAWLHDYAAIIGMDFEQHHIYGATEAEKILKSFNYPQEKIEKVKKCILEHRGSIKTERKNLESICLSSADAMAHIDQIPSLFFLVYKIKEMSVEEGILWVSNKTERSWNKLCPEAKEIIKDKYEALKIIANA